MTQNKSPLKPILSHPNKTITLLRLQVEQQTAVLKRIKAGLPNDLADHVLHCVVNGKKLLIYTSSAAWASQLRFHNRTILDAATTVDARFLSSLHVKVINLPSSGSTNNKPSARIPTQAVADEIGNHSETMADPQIKKALKKLSSTLKRVKNRQES